jgi:hypothetical protein
MLDRPFNSNLTLSSSRLLCAFCIGRLGYMFSIARGSALFKGGIESCNRGWL